MNVIVQSAATSPVFTGSVAPFLLVDRELIIRGANAAYLRATGQTSDSILGRAMFDAFPDNPYQTDADGVRKLSASFEIVLRTGRAHEMQLQRYDVPLISGHRGFQEKHWLPVNSPLADENGHVVAILHHVEDVTDAALLLESPNPVAHSPADQMRSLLLGASRMNAVASSLGQRNARLSEALCAVVATRTTLTSATGFSRRAELWRAIAAKTVDRTWSGWARALCETAVEALDTIDAAAIALVRDGGAGRYLLAATSPSARDLSIVETLPASPSSAALHSNAPVIADPLTDETVRWPEYVAAAVGGGIAAVAAYPLSVSPRPFGVLVLYRHDADLHATRSEDAEAAIFADLAASAVLADLDRRDDPLEPMQDAAGRPVVAAATRVLALRHDVSYDNALTRLRIHALLHGQATVDTALQVLRRTIRYID